MDYYQKYLKYKNKYTQLKKDYGLDKVSVKKIESETKDELEPKIGFIDMLKKYNPDEYRELFEIDNTSYNTIILQPNYQIKKKKLRSDLLGKTNLLGGSKTPQSWDFIVDNLKRILNTEGLSVTISPLSDVFDPESHESDYGGVIFWHNHGNKEIIPGVNAITVIIQDTRKWSKEDFGASGNGIVHNKLYKDLLGDSIHNTGPAVAACFSGFSFIYNEINSYWIVKFSSWYANSNTLWTVPIQNCDNNYSKMTLNGEAIAIIGAVNQWIKNGVNSVVRLEYIPEEWSLTEILDDRYFWVLHDYDSEYPYEPSKWKTLPSYTDPDTPNCVPR